ncbi:MAG: hypothetical protein Kow0059_21160 [Candidatus Sumerlaeia bacterium]
MDYKPVIVYRYDVGGQSYESSRFDYTASPFNRSEEDAKRIVAQYPPGTPVTVYYNPSYPQQAVLRRGVGRATLYLIGLSVLYIAFGVFLLTKWMRTSQ